MAACGSASTPPLTHCPKQPPGLAGGSPGTEGETVEPQPESALICRWRSDGQGRTERAEAVIGPGLAGLVATLNSLPPPLEGEFACPEIVGSLKYLVALRYRDSSEVEVEADESGCGGAFTEDHSWGVGNIQPRLDALLDGS